jgi:hypothetical protein
MSLQLPHKATMVDIQAELDAMNISHLLAVLSVPII